MLFKKSNIRDKKMQLGEKRDNTLPDGGEYVQNIDFKFPFSLFLEGICILPISSIGRRNPQRGRRSPR
jgi:hypothetical protein